MLSNKSKGLRYFQIIIKYVLEYNFIFLMDVTKN